MRWGKPKREVRNYANAALEAQWLHATGDPAPTASASAALETAAGLYSRAFAGAQVENGPSVTPQVLASIARSLIRRGECVHLIDVARDGLRLREVGSHDVRGPANESAWSYRITMSGPSESPSRIVPGSQVVHCRYATAPQRPWAGVAPMTWASATGKLHGAVEDAMLSEASIPAMVFLPLQDVPPDALDSLRVNIENARTKRKRGVVMPTVSATSGSTRSQQRPLSDWQPRPIGPRQDDGSVSLRDDTAVAVLGACGVPPSLAIANSDGTGQRESFRRFLHSSVVPLARLVEHELSIKLDSPVRLSFDQLFAADLSGRARAFQSLVGGGMDLSKAAALAGLLAIEGD